MGYVLNLLKVILKHLRTQPTMMHDDEMLNREMTKGELQHFFKNYKTAGKSFDNIKFHPIKLK